MISGPEENESFDLCWTLMQMNNVLDIHNVADDMLFLLSASGMVSLILGYGTEITLVL